MKSLDQAIHDKLWLLSAGFVGNDNVFEYRPMTEVAYPFIDFQDFQTNFGSTKNGLTATASVTINIWDKEDNRKNVSEICNDLIQQILTTREFFGYPVAIKMSGTNFRIIKDTTVKPYIWRGLINLEFLV